VARYPGTTWVVVACLAIALIGIGIRFSHPDIAKYLWMASVTILGAYALGFAIVRRYHAYHDPKTPEQIAAEKAADEAAMRRELADHSHKQARPESRKRSYEIREHHPDQKPRAAQARKPKKTD
jgi:ABC-type nickel/cobalt efflux system permease component RcnA